MQQVWVLCRKCLGKFTELCGWYMVLLALTVTALHTLAELCALENKNSGVTASASDLKYYSGATARASDASAFAIYALLLLLYLYQYYIKINIWKLCLCYKEKKEERILSHCK